MKLTEQISQAKGGNKLTIPVLSPTQVKNISEFNFRALPYSHQEEENPFIEVFVHNNIGKDKKQFALCPNRMFGEFCPYCETANKLKDKLEAEEWKTIAKKFYPKASVYIPGLARFKKGSEFTFLKVSQFQNFKKEIVEIITNPRLKEAFNISEDVPFIKVWDYKAGLDFVIKKNEKSASNMYESFTIDHELKLTPVAVKTRPEEIQLVKEYSENVPDAVEDMKNTWGASEKINEAFTAQYPKYASQYGMGVPESENNDLPDGLETQKAPVPPTQQEEKPKPTDDNDIDSLLSDGIQENDSTIEDDPESDGGNTPDSSDIDDDYEQLMNKL